METNKLAFTASKQEIVDLAYDLSLTKYRKRIAVDTENLLFPFLMSVPLRRANHPVRKLKLNISSYLTAKEQKSADHFDFDGEGVCVPLISATGHGKAAMKECVM